MHNPKHTAVAMHSPQEDAALATLALSLLSAIGEGVGLAERNGKLIWANDMLAKLGPTMLERIAMACRQFQNEHPLPPPSVTLPSGWLPPKSERRVIAFMS
jgi:hypothetical protein